MAYLPCQVRSQKFNHHRIPLLRRLQLPTTTTRVLCAAGGRNIYKSLTWFHDTFLTFLKSLTTQIVPSTFYSYHKPVFSHRHFFSSDTLVSRALLSGLPFPTGFIFTKNLRATVTLLWVKTFFLHLWVTLQLCWRDFCASPWSSTPFLSLPGLTRS